MAVIVEVEVGVVHFRFGSISRELVFRENRQIRESDAEELVAVAKEIELSADFIDLHCELRAPRLREGCTGGVLEVVACEEAHQINVPPILKIVCVSQIDVALPIRLQDRRECAMSARVYRHECCASIHAP